jgi:Ca2+-binding EF-hand superfamily protein
MVCGTLIAASLSAFAMDETMHPMPMKMALKAMDTNNDGMISKDEFMKYHEMKFAQMKKNKDGLVDINDMMTMHKEMKDDVMAKDAMHKETMNK